MQQLPASTALHAGSWPPGCHARPSGTLICRSCVSQLLVNPLVHHTAGGDCTLPASSQATSRAVFPSLLLGIKNTRQRRRGTDNSVHQHGGARQRAPRARSGLDDHCTHAVLAYRHAQTDVSRLTHPGSCSCCRSCSLQPLSGGPWGGRASPQRPAAWHPGAWPPSAACCACGCWRAFRPSCRRARPPTSSCAWRCCCSSRS